MTLTDGIRPAGRSSDVDDAPSGPSGMAQRASAPERIILIGLVLGQIYYAYRYAFKYDDPGTSPTYGPTPAAWQLGKYIIFVGLFVACAVLLLRQHRRRPSSLGLTPVLALLTYVLLTLTVIAVGSAPSTVSSLTKAWFFLPLIMLMPFAWRGRASVVSFLKATALLVVYNAAYEAIQLALFYGDGRLPAQGYPNSALVRFGGGLDDPNGFGIWLSLPILVLIAGWPQRLKLAPRVITLCVLGFLLYHTFSFSSLIGFGVGVTALLALTCDTRKTIAAAFVGIAAAGWLLTSGTFASVFQDKAQSASTRFTLTSGLAPGQKSVSQYLSEANVGQWLIGAPGKAAPTETTYLAVLMNDGLVTLFLLLAIVIFTAVRGAKRVRYLRRTGDQAGVRMYAGLTACFIAMSVSAFGVPLITEVFPTSMTYWMVGMALWLPSGSARAGARPGGSSPRDISLPQS